GNENGQLSELCSSLDRSILQNRSESYWPVGRRFVRHERAHGSRPREGLGRRFTRLQNGNPHDPFLRKPVGPRYVYRGVGRAVHGESKLSGDATSGDGGEKD